MDTPEPFKFTGCAPVKTEIRYVDTLGISGYNMRYTSLAVNYKSGLTAGFYGKGSKLFNSFLCDKLVLWYTSAIKSLQTFFVLGRKSFEITVYFCYCSLPFIYVLLIYNLIFKTISHFLQFMFDGVVKSPIYCIVVIRKMLDVLHVRLKLSLHHYSLYIELFNLAIYSAIFNFETIIFGYIYIL